MIMRTIFSAFANGTGLLMVRWMALKLERAAGLSRLPCSRCCDAADAGTSLVPTTRGIPVWFTSQYGAYTLTTTVPLAASLHKRGIR